jgi:hypothetical protein
VPASRLYAPPRAVLMCEAVLAMDETERLSAWFAGALAAAGEPSRLYAILDGARDVQIVAKLRAADVPTLCLFDGELHPSLAAAAPYLVALGPEAAFTRSLIAEGWGQAWGVYLISGEPIEALRRHFRRFLRVADERGRTLMFRYYDPRVLRVYLPTCTREELEVVFGPVSSFYLEGPGGAIELRCADGGLVTGQGPRVG